MAPYACVYIRIPVVDLRFEVLILSYAAKTIMGLIPPLRISTNRTTFDIRVYYSVVTTKILNDFETQKFFRSIRKFKLKLIINRKLILFLHLIENSDGI